jgi:hypothetical protein
MEKSWLCIASLKFVKVFRSLKYPGTGHILSLWHRPNLIIPDGRIIPAKIRKSQHWLTLQPKESKFNRNIAVSIKTD